MLKSRLVETTYGRCRVVDTPTSRWYVSRTDVKTYVVHTATTLTLDTMVEIDGEYHFGTLRELDAALGRHENKSSIPCNLSKE